MTFKPGESGNPQGYKSTGHKLLKKFRALYEDGWDVVKEDFRQLKPRERLELLAKILPKNLDIGTENGLPIQFNITKTYAKPGEKIDVE